MDSSATAKALSTLEAEILAIQRYVDSLEKWLWVFSAMVIVGVACELYFVFHTYKDDREAWSRGIIAPPSKPSLRMLWLEIASILLVVVGIAGETWIGAMSSLANGDLRDKNNDRVSYLRKLVSDAESEATGATREATAAKTQVSKNALETATARLESAKANARAAEASLLSQKNVT